MGYLPFELSNLYPFLETQKNMLLVKQSAGMDLEEGACHHDHGSFHDHGFLKGILILMFGCLPNMPR